MMPAAHSSRMPRRGVMPLAVSAARIADELAAMRELLGEFMVDRELCVTLLLRGEQRAGD